MLAPADEAALVVRGGVFGNRVVVLCVERVPRKALRELPAPEPATFYSAGGSGRGHEAARQSVLSLHPYDELRNVCFFDGRREPVRTAKRPMVQANASGAMASLLMGEHENGELTGQHIPAVGQHVMGESGSTRQQLCGGLGMLVKDQRYKLVLGTQTQWSLAFEEEVPGCGPGASATDILEQRYPSAMRALRDSSVTPSFFRYSQNGRNFAAVQGDVEGSAAVGRVLEAMREACVAVNTVD